MNFKMATMVAILDIGKGTNKAILNFHVSQMPPTKFNLFNLTNRLGADVI